MSLWYPICDHIDIVGFAGLIHLLEDKYETPSRTHISTKVISQKRTGSIATKLSPKTTDWVKLYKLLFKTIQRSCYQYLVVFPENHTKITARFLFSVCVIY